MRPQPAPPVAAETRAGRRFGVRLECGNRAEDEEPQGTASGLGSRWWQGLRVKSWRGHHLELKSSRRTRRYEGKTSTGESLDQIRRLLPYLGVWIVDGTRQRGVNVPSSPQAPSQRRRSRTALTRAHQAAHELRCMRWPTRRVTASSASAQMRELWIIRINAAARQNGLSYGK